MKYTLAITSLVGALTIILGAFGAHALKDILSENQLQSFETAVRYQMFHVLAVLFINQSQNLTSFTKKQISIVFLIGIVLFSGSIYAITMGGIEAKLIWFVTPLGGLFLIIGWILMFYNFLRSRNF